MTFSDINKTFNIASKTGGNVLKKGYEEIFQMVSNLDLNKSQQESLQDYFGCISMVNDGKVTFTDALSFELTKENGKTL